MSALAPATTGVRFKEGDYFRLSVQYYSATQVLAAALINVTYDDGTTGSITINQQTSATARAIVTNQKDKVQSKPGVITSATTGIDGGFPSAVTQPGMLYMELYLARAGYGDTIMLIGDYNYNGHEGTYPGLIRQRREGPGRLYTAAGADPAAGAEVADTVPAKAYWRLKAIEVVLVTDGTVANRNTNLFVDDAQTTITRYLMLTDTTNQTATQTRTHSWTPGTDNDSTASVSVTDGVTLLAKFPMSLQNGVTLQAADNIRTVTTGIVAGDNYGAARYIVEEWLSQ